MCVLCIYDGPNDKEQVVRIFQEHINIYDAHDYIFMCLCIRTLFSNDNLTRLAQAGFRPGIPEWWPKLIMMYAGLHNCYL